MYDVAVVGAGIIGSWTAYHLAKNPNCKVVLFDQFAAGHDGGSSHGDSRVFGPLTTDHATLQLIKDAREQWIEFEKGSGQQLFLQNGRIILYNENNLQEMNKSADAYRKVGLESEVLDAGKIEELVPQLHVESNQLALFEKFSGIILADRSLNAVQDAFVALGGEVRFGTKIWGIDPLDDFVVLMAQKSEDSAFARNVVICGGAFTNFLVPDLVLPLQIMAYPFLYWKKIQKDLYTSDSCPIIKSSASGLQLFPSFAAIEIVKIMRTFVDMVQIGAPHERNALDYTEISKSAAGTIPELFGGVDCRNGPARIDKCIFTLTPDNYAILDKHPRFPNVTIGAGFCGSGYEPAPVFGQMLASISNGEEASLPYNLEPYKLARFR